MIRLPDDADQYHMTFTFALPDRDEPGSLELTVYVGDSMRRLHATFLERLAEAVAASDELDLTLEVDVRERRTL